MNAVHAAGPGRLARLPRRVDVTAERMVSVVEHDGLTIEVTASFQDHRLSVLVNGAKMGETTTAKEVIRGLTQGSTSSHEVRAWFEDAPKPLIETVSNPMMRFGGVGITVDGMPVENTLSDPWVHIREGRPAIWLFVVSFCVKAFLVTRLNVEIGPLMSALYGAGAALLGYFAITFNAKPKRGILTGLVLGAVDTLDSLAGLPARLSYGFSYQPLIFLGLRVLALVSLWNAIRHSSSTLRR